LVISIYKNIVQNIDFVCANNNQTTYGYQLKNYRGLKFMKRITPVILTAFSALALSFSVSTFADNIDSDGFVIFGAQTIDASQTASSDSAEQKQADSSAVVEQSASSESAAEQTQEVAPAKKPKATKKKRNRKAKNKPRKRAKRAKRTVRKKRSTRTTRAQRSSSLRRASSYRVKKGDTLYRISVRSGSSLSRLIRLNKLHGSKKHKIQAGQRIRLR